MVLGMWKAINFGPFIVNKDFAGGAGELKGPEDSQAFIEKRKKLRIYTGSENALKKVYMMLADPYTKDSR